MSYSFQSAAKEKASARSAADNTAGIGKSNSAIPVQFTRKSNKIEYATDDADAVAWLSANIAGWAKLSEEDKELGLNIAKDKLQGVLEAKKVLNDTGEIEKNAKKRRADRLELVKDDYDSYTGTFGDADANLIFELMHSGFVSGNKNLLLGGGDRTQVAVDATIADFEKSVERGNDLADNITNFHWFRSQDKAAAGKGRVGDTLATRAVQANFIATWGGVVINVHVDING